ncbi:uncharacterized protein FIBRA_03035 [Fibroporia radiculosa]|uniref:Cytochrome P450 n=1 Tax=Fibroporia radiculosa TaxID=599839 RepID=J4HVR8_9APHY|nr:uncharacterized protein FIBRA_03035 [Fibroporia radiculosa]CCM00987.1 predicted protein [Fibroporia radiculosa]
MPLVEVWSSFLILGSVALAWQYLEIRKIRNALRNIAGPPSASYVKGNIPQFFSRDSTNFQRHLAFDYPPVAKLYSMFGRPMLYVSDPKALHTVMIKEEPSFPEPDSFIGMNSLLFGRGLLATLGQDFVSVLIAGVRTDTTRLAGDTHRKQRKLLNPAFSINHMRHIIPIFYNVVHRLREGIRRQVAGGTEEIDMLNWMGRTALELIGQGGLGYSFDPLVEDVHNEYGHALKTLVPNMVKLPVVRLMVPYLMKVGPAAFRRLIINLIPDGDVQRVKCIVDTMDFQSRDIFEKKKAALLQGEEAVLQQVGEGKDIISILMRANASTSEADRLPEDQIIAQMSTLVFAATDTTSNTLARILQILAERPDVQEKLRAEVLDAHAGESLSYDELDQLPLLDSVCRETLRLNPPAQFTSRVANRDTILPLSEPIVGIDGSLITEIPLVKGTEVMIGILGCNASKQLWGEDAHEWKPERWLAPLPGKVTKSTIPGVYANLMTFVGGKRACIGFKFSEMEMKVVLAVLLTNFTFELTGKPIVWNAAGVRYPTVGSVSNQPQMPLKVRLYQGAKA